MLKRTIRVVIRWLERLIDEPENDVHTSTKHQLADVAHTRTQDSHYDVQLNMSDNLDGTHELDLEIVPESVHDDVQEMVHDVTPRPEGFLRVLSFLGAGTLNQTCYLLDNNANQSGVTTRYTGYATHQLLQADETLFFCTVAADVNYERMCIEHPGFLAQKRIRIPEGMSTDEMWQVFGVLTEHIIDGEHIVVDISNSFRSLPVIVLAALSYLQEVRNVTIYRLVYGAYAHNAGISTAIINLQPFVDLSKWVQATHVLIHYGQGKELAHLMRQVTATKRDPWLRIASVVNDINAALQLVNLDEVAKLAADFRTKIDDLPDDLPNHLLPIKQLLTHAALKYDDFLPTETVQSELKRQQRIIRWYLDHYLYVQAMLLAREFLISLAIYRSKSHMTGKLLHDAVNNKAQRDGVDLFATYTVNNLGRRMVFFRNNLAHPSTRGSIKNLREARANIIELCQEVIEMKIT